MQASTVTSPDVQVSAQAAATGAQFNANLSLFTQAANYATLLQPDTNGTLSSILDQSQEQQQAPVMPTTNDVTNFAEMQTCDPSLFQAGTGGHTPAVCDVTSHFPSQAPSYSSSSATAAGTAGDVSGNEFAWSGLESQLSYASESSVGAGATSTVTSERDRKKKESKGYHVFLSKDQTRILWSWMLSHLQFPYPSKTEINALAVLIRATPVQIYQW